MELTLSYVWQQALPESYEKEFKYGELIKPVPLPDHRGLYSKDNILIVGAQVSININMIRSWIVGSTKGKGYC